MIIIRLGESWCRVKSITGRAAKDFLCLSGKRLIHIAAHAQQYICSFSLRVRKCVTYPGKGTRFECFCTTSISCHLINSGPSANHTRLQERLLHSHQGPSLHDLYTPVVCKAKVQERHPSNPCYSELVLPRYNQQTSNSALFDQQHAPLVGNLKPTEKASLGS